MRDGHAPYSKSIVLTSIKPKSLDMEDESEIFDEERYDGNQIHLPEAKSTRMLPTHKTIHH